MDDPTRTTFGEIAADAPPELRTFAFLIGQWEGQGRTKLPDGTVAEFPVRWIGRYVLDGTAIADELHGPAPDGSPYLGINLRQFDRSRKAWVIEYLNVTGSFLRRQVNSRAGSVQVAGSRVTVHSESPGTRVREHYDAPGRDAFTYRLDVSGDDGRTWNEGQIEMTFARKQ